MRETALKLVFAGTLFLVVLIGRYHTPYVPVSTGETVRQTGAVLPSAFSNLSGAEQSSTPVPLPPRAAGYQNGGDRPGVNEAPLAGTAGESTAALSQPRASLYLVSFLGEDADSMALAADKHWPIASISKLMTAIVAEEEIAQSALIKVTPEAEATEGTAGGLRVGGQYTLSDLMRALLLVSSNDAAVALADEVGYDRFMAQMNAKAAELGMLDTYFKDPSGLSALNQSTLHDLKRLMTYLASAHPDILAFTCLPRAEIVERGTGTRRTLLNINKFAGREDFIGGKTGFTDDSGENLISLFSRQGKILFVGVLDAEDRFVETERALSVFDAR